MHGLSQIYAVIGNVTSSGKKMPRKKLGYQY